MSQGSRGALIIADWEHASVAERAVVERWWAKPKKAKKSAAA